MNNNYHNTLKIIKINAKTFFQSQKIREPTNTTLTNKDILTKVLS